MTILFDATAPVKSSKPFGAGLLPAPASRPIAEPAPSRPRPFEPSATDRAWWAKESARLEAERIISRVRELEYRAAESAAVDSLCGGFVPADWPRPARNAKSPRGNDWTDEDQLRAHGCV